MATNHLTVMALNMCIDILNRTCSLHTAINMGSAPEVVVKIIISSFVKLIHIIKIGVYKI